MDEIAEQLGSSRPRALQMYLCRCNTWKWSVEWVVTCVCGGACALRAANLAEGGLRSCGGPQLLHEGAQKQLLV